MMKIIQLLKKNSYLLRLLKEQRICLIGISKEENKAILDTYSIREKPNSEGIWK